MPYKETTCAISIPKESDNYCSLIRDLHNVNENFFFFISYKNKFFFIKKKIIFKTLVIIQC